MNVFQHHPRRFADYRYVYPVISRRSDGLSLGVNLSPTALCNFACVYCQVLAEETPQSNVAGKIDIEQLESELIALFQSYRDGSLFENSHLSHTPTEKRVLKDIAFSGDGEPTLSPQFGEVVSRIAALRKKHGVDEAVKIVLITNASTLNVPATQAALETLLQNNGEIWAKLDTGSEKFFKTVSRASVSFDRIVSNLQTFSETHPLIIQTCFFNMHGQCPDETEVSMYCEKLRTLKNIRYVQLYTVARSTPEAWVAPLTNKQLNAFADTIQNKTGLEVRRFYSS